MVLSWNNYKGLNQKETVGERLSILVREQEHKQLIINVEKEAEGNREEESSYYKRGKGLVKLTVEVSLTQPQSESHLKYTSRATLCFGGVKS